MVKGIIIIINGMINIKGCVKMEKSSCGKQRLLLLQKGYRQMSMFTSTFALESRFIEKHKIDFSFSGMNCFKPCFIIKFSSNINFLCKLNRFNYFTAYGTTYTRKSVHCQCTNQYFSFAHIHFKQPNAIRVVHLINFFVRLLLYCRFC